MFFHQDALLAWTPFCMQCHLLIHAEIYIYIYIYILDTYRLNEQQTQEDFFINIFTSHFICKGTNGYSEFACERKLETEYNWNILIPKLWPSALYLSRSPWLLNRSPEVHSARCWLSLLYLVSLPLQLYSTQLSPSVQFVGLILPSNSHGVVLTRLHASTISSHIWRSGCITSAFFGMAFVIVIERK